MAATGGLAAGFFRSVEQYPDRPALELSGASLSYRRLGRKALDLAHALVEASPSSDPPLTAVFAHRSWTAYSAVLAVLARGHGYVPLSPTVPIARNREILDRVGCQALVADAAGASQLEGLLDDRESSLVVLLPDRRDAADLEGRWPRHAFRSAAHIQANANFTPRGAKEGDVAYLLFTSGSTGKPKGVMVSHANIRHFLDCVAGRYAISPDDRLTQLFELVFDLSLFDLFASWDAGACVCSPSPSELLLPARFIEAAKPTVWFSVPSTAWLMQQQRALFANAFPTLRLSLFCGEALPAAIARAWKEAAPASVVENLYGPTELTVACTRYQWRGDETDDECENGVVPIGDPFPNMTALIVDEDGERAAPGRTGELWMAGPQVSLGYYRAPELTQAAFVVPKGETKRYYRTGDRVRAPRAGEPIRYIGRADHQIKIRGHRVELGEIEAALRDATGVQGVAAVGWPITPAGATGVVAFVHASNVDVVALRRKLGERLPKHMTPNDIQLVDSLPLTTSGKVDRGRLIQHYAHAVQGPRQSGRFSGEEKSEGGRHAAHT